MRYFQPLLATFLFLAAALPGDSSAQTPLPSATDADTLSTRVFRLGEIVAVGQRSELLASVGGSVITAPALRTFDRRTLDEAVNLVPGVVSTLDSNGRRNESDIFVRGFGRWQVPLLVDGVRIYLPADNRIDFSRFMTSNLAAVQVQKGYASVLDGPGAMGGAINLVTSRPVEARELEGGLSLGGRSEFEEWHGFVRAGSRLERFYAQGSLGYAERDFWSLSGRYDPPANTLQPSGTRLGSDTRDWSLNLKAGFTPNETDEYVVNFIHQEGRKGGLLNINQNPPIPPNSFWRWPWWNVQSVAFLSSTRIGTASELKTKLYRNTFDNALFAYDDISYSSQAMPGRFRSYYDDESYGATIQFGTSLLPRQSVRFALHYRDDAHVEWQHLRPDAPPANSLLEPRHEQSLTTWSVAVENTVHARDDLDLVLGASFDDYRVTKAEEFSPQQGIFERPRGGASAVNAQGAVVWRYGVTGQVHASVSNRARFPALFELYSSGFGTVTPNPDLGPEQATNIELGWSELLRGSARVSGAVFYSDVRNLIQTMVLADATTQRQNVGDGRFLGFELAADVHASPRLRFGGNYTYIDREIRDALPASERPSNVAPLQPTGVPPHRAFLYVGWEPVRRLSVTPSLEYATDRWSDMVTNPVQAFPYVETGAHTLVNVGVEYGLARAIDLTLSLRNLLDEHYELSWGLPQRGRSIHGGVRARL